MLYIVATPIGNLDDFSPRAIKTLQQVTLIAAEDTRHSGNLLRHFGINTPMISLHEHNETERAAMLLERLKRGESIALITDAGTPLVSDPGYKIVKLVRENNIDVVPIPGPCAAITALSAAGLPSDRFIFEGFLPSKQTARIKRLKTIAKETRTLIFYESPHRVLDTLQDMVTEFGADRYAVVARELTKLYEDIRGAQLASLLHWFQSNSEAQCGEFVILVAGVEETAQHSAEEITRILILLLEELPLKQAVSLAAKITHEKKNILYQLALTLSKKYTIMTD